MFDEIHGRNGFLFSVESDQFGGGRATTIITASGVNLRPKVHGTHCARACCFRSRLPDTINCQVKAADHSEPKEVMLWQQKIATPIRRRRITDLGTTLTDIASGRIRLITFIRNGLRLERIRDTTSTIFSQ